MTRKPRLVPDTPEDRLLDVVVIGGSEAGLAMAWHLARQGHPPPSRRVDLDPVGDVAPGGAEALLLRTVAFSSKSPGSGVSCACAAGEVPAFVTANHGPRMTAGEPLMTSDMVFPSRPPGAGRHSRR
jgi:hypothetical protein